MFAIICLNIMLLISCWYLIAENQKNKNKINDLQDDLNKAIKRLAALEEGVTQKSWFRRNRFCRVTPAKFIRYLKSFYKANLDINKPLALYVRIFSAKGTLKFLRITYARTHQEVSHKTKLIGLCLLLRLWVIIWTLLNFRTFGAVTYFGLFDQKYNEKI